MSTRYKLAAALTALASMGTSYLALWLLARSHRIALVFSVCMWLVLGPQLFVIMRWSVARSSQEKRTGPDWAFGRKMQRPALVSAAAMMALIYGVVLLHGEVYLVAGIFLLIGVALTVQATRMTRARCYQTWTPKV